MMKKAPFPITGFVKNDKKEYGIYADNYTYTFLDNTERKGGTWEKLSTQDGFIRGTTHNGQQLAIYTGNHSISINGYGTLKSNMFLMSQTCITSEGINTFSSISFSGGTLNLLFQPQAIKRTMNKNGEQIEYNDDSIKYNMNLGSFDCQIVIQSGVKGTLSDYGGSIINEDVFLTISFTKEQTFLDIPKYYNCVMDCLSFMTNRKNVSVDEIEIGPNEKGVEKISKSFDVFIKDNMLATKKQSFQCISFSDLGESFVNLFLMFYNSTDEKRLYSLGFYPQNDKEVYTVSNALVRSLCSSLEYEADQEDRMKNEENKQIKNLAKTVKEVVKNHQKANKDAPLITNDSYNLIYNSISHWSLTAKERIQLLYRYHRREMHILTRYIEPCTDEDIGEFVSFRNNITHGAERIMSSSVARTSLILRGLVFCCVLKRIGISESKICDLCELQINN